VLLYRYRRRLQRRARELRIWYDPEYEARSPAPAHDPKQDVAPKTFRLKRLFARGEKSTAVDDVASSAPAADQTRDAATPANNTGSDGLPKWGAASAAFLQPEPPPPLPTTTTTDK